MASPFACLVITPNADQVAVQSQTGITLNVPVYVAADPTPRVAWGAWANTPDTDVIEASIETPTTGARAVFPNTSFTKYDRRTTPKFDPQAVLAGLGLTTQQN